MSFSAGSGSASLGSAEGRIVIDVEAAQRNIKQLQGSIGTFATNTESAFNRVATGVGLLAGARAIFGVFRAGIGTAANLEQAMSGVAAALGGVGTAAGITEDQFAALNEEAIRIGSTTSVSANEAAVAMELMAKAGIDLERILNGGAQAAVNISEATGEGLPQAASTMSAVLLLFQQTGITADRAADIIVSGMNASNASMSEFQTGLARLAPTISLTGLTLEDAAAAIAFFNSQGLSAAEAGTSLNAAFLSITNPTADMTAALNELGIAAFDAQGNFVGFPDLFDQVQQATSGMANEQDRAAVLTRAFGRDALDVMAIAATQGSDALRDLIGEMDATGTAAAASAQRMDNLAGDTEEFGGVIESIAATIFSRVLPAFRELVQAATSIARAFSALPVSLQLVAAGGVATAGVIAAIAGAMVLAGPRAAAFADALKLIRASLLGMNPLVLAVVGALALFGVAYKTNFAGFRDFIDTLTDRVQAFGDVFRREFEFGRQLRGFGNVGAPIRALGAAMQEILGLEVVDEFNNIGRAANRIGVSLGRMRRQFNVLGRAFERGGLREGFEALFGDVGQKLLNEFGDLIGALPRTVGTALRQIHTGIVPLDNALRNLGTAFVQFGRFVENVFAGNFDTALANLKIIGQRLKLGAINVSNLTVRIASWAFETAIDLGTAVLDFVTDDLWPVVTQTAATVAGYVVSISEWAVEEGTTLAGDIADWVTNTAWPAVRDTATDVAGKVINLTSFVIRSGASIFDAISETVQAAWELVKGVAVNIADVALNVLNFGIRVGASIWDAVDDTVRAAWELVKGTAIDIADVSVNVVSWLTDQLEAGTLVDSVRAFIETQLATVNVFMDDWTLRVGAPGEDQVTVDVGAIFGAIWDALTVPLVVDPANQQKAEEAGRNFGVKAVELIVGAIHDFFMPGGGADSESDKIGIDQVATAFFTGMLGGINDALDDALTAWLGEPSDVGGKILGKLQDMFVDPFTEIGGPQGPFMERIRSVFTGMGDLIGEFWDNFVDILTGQEAGLGGITLPDLVTPVTTWFDEQIAAIKEGLLGAVPDWMKSLANGDVLGAVKSLFGSGPSGPSDDEIAAELANLQAQARPSSGGGAGHGGGFSARPFLESGTTFGEALGDGIIAGIGNKREDVATALRNLANPPSDAGAGGAPQTTPKAPERIKLPAPDISALVKGFADATRATSESMRDIAAETAALVNPLRQAAQTALQGFVSTLSSGFGIAVNAAANGATQVTNAVRANLGSLAGAGFSVGQSLGFGIASGIASTINTVAQSAINLIDAAINAAKARAQIGSPSRLFAREVGLPIAQGMAVGVRDGTRTVQRSIGDLIGASVPQTSASMLGRQPIGVAASGARGGNTIIVVNAVKSDEMVNLLRQAERGSTAMDVWDDYVGRAPSLIFGGAI